MPELTELDHVAIAAQDLTDLFPRYAGDLAGGWVGMGPDPDFSFAQLRFGNGSRLELVEPREEADDDSLRRFLERTGPGPHHLTFKVPDLHATLDTLVAAGYHPERVSYDDPEWFEAVLGPEEATGVVIKIAEAHRGTPITPVP